MNAVSVAAVICRWGARVVGSLVFLLFVGVCLMARLPNFFTAPLIVELGYLGMILLMLGTMAGWRWELAGAILSLVGVCLMVEPTRQNGHVTWFFGVLATPGVLYLVSHVLHLRGAAGKNASSDQTG